MKKVLAICLILIASTSLTYAMWPQNNWPQPSNAPYGWQDVYSSPYYPTMNWYYQNGAYIGYDLNRANWQGGYNGLQPWVMYYPGAGWFSGYGRGY